MGSLEKIKLIIKAWLTVLYLYSFHQNTVYLEMEGVN